MAQTIVAKGALDVTIFGYLAKTQNSGAKKNEFFFFGEELNDRVYWPFMVWQSERFN